MSIEQRETLDSILRQSPIGVGRDVQEQRRLFQVLLDDAVRLAQRAAADDVGVTLDITPGVPHVFQAFHAALGEAVKALERAGQLLRAQLSSVAGTQTRTCPA
jgi:hypothetical protein